MHFAPASLKAILEALTDVGGTLETVKVMLFKNNLAEEDIEVFADLEEVTETGYAKSAVVVWDAAAQLSSETGNYAMSGDKKSFTTTDGSQAETAYGYAVISEAPNTLHFARVFDTPELLGAGSNIQIVPRFGFDNVAEVPNGDVTVT